MAEEKTLEDLINSNNNDNKELPEDGNNTEQEKQHLDMSRIKFPQDAGEEKRRKQAENEAAIKQAGLDSKIFIYDENQLEQVKDIDKYDNDTKREIELWLAIGNNMDIFNSAKELPSLKRLELFRRIISESNFSKYDLLNPYVKYQNEFNDEMLNRLVNYNTFLSYQDEDGKPKLRSIDLPDDISDRQNFYDTIDDRLIVVAFADIEKMAKDNDIFNQGYSKEILDQIIIGFANKVDVIKNINSAIELGVLDEFPKDASSVELVKKMRNKLEDSSSPISVNDRFKSIDEIVNRVLEANAKSLEVIHAKDLNIESNHDAELTAAKEAEEEKAKLKAEAEKEEKAKKAQKAVEEAKKQKEHEDAIEHENDLSNNNFAVIPSEDNYEVPAKRIINNKKGNKDLLLNRAMNGYSSPEEIAAEFDKIIDYLSMFKESVLRSIK